MDLFLNLSSLVYLTLQVPNLDFVDNDSVFKQWNKEHPLTDSQSRCLLNIIQDANHPLYTQVLLASGATWRSFDSISKLKKQVPRSSGTPEDMLTKTVAVICKRYPSEDIVHRILAYITFFQREPLREAELLDILALDNSLLELVATHYAYNVGIGRMCDIIWCDIALRLHPFLVPLSKDKVCWCHDAIALAARKFYLEPILHQIASIAAEYVTGAYSNTTKPLQLRPATANILGIDCHGTYTTLPLHFHAFHRQNNLPVAGKFNFQLVTIYMPNCKYYLIAWHMSFLN